MDEPPTPPYGTPRRPVVRRPDSGSSVVSPATGPGGPAPSRDRDDAGRRWRHLPRTARGAVGLALVAAALLLWPFSGWFWVPWLAGLVALVLVALLRLDRLLGGWTWHVGGLAVVVGLMLRTGPWDWALAGSLGVLLAGLVQLPMWRLAAVGAVLCTLAGVGWGFDRYRDAQQVAAEQAQASQLNRGQLRVVRPNLVLQVVLNSISRGDVGPVCGSLLAEPARPPFAVSVGAPDCPSAVRVLATQVNDRAMYARGRAPSTAVADGLVVDACRIEWPAGAVPGPQLGVLTVGRVGTEVTYLVTAFEPCSS